MVVTALLRFVVVELSKWRYITSMIYDTPIDSIEELIRIRSKIDRIN